MNIWDIKFKAEEYIYGINPNEYLKSELAKLRIGKILLPAEGEGRNAVYAAQLGWNVSAFDQSTEGQIKAFKLAKEKQVEIKYEINSFENFESVEIFDCIAFIYAHLEFENQFIYYNKILKSIKLGGHVILEGFSEKQLNYKSGGPKSIDMLYSIEKVKFIFTDIKFLNLEEVEIELEEGKHHSGKASVIRMSGIKM